MKLLTAAAFAAATLTTGLAASGPAAAAPASAACPPVVRHHVAAQTVHRVVRRTVVLHRLAPRHRPVEVVYEAPPERVYREHRIHRVYYAGPEWRGEPYYGGPHWNGRWGYGHHHWHEGGFHHWR